MQKSGHVTITKIENLHIENIHVEKFTDSKSVILFDLRRTIMKLSWKKPFQDSGVTRRLWTLGCVELTVVLNISF